MLLLDRWSNREREVEIGDTHARTQDPGSLAGKKKVRRHGDLTKPNDRTHVKIAG